MQVARSRSLAVGALCVAVAAVVAVLVIATPALLCSGSSADRDTEGASPATMAGRLDEEQFLKYCSVTERFHTAERPPPRKLNMIRWVHVPKTGTSFGTALLHYACDDLPLDAKADYTASEQLGVTQGVRQHYFMANAMRAYYKPEYCGRSGVKLFVQGHTPLQRRQLVDGHQIVAFLRDPRVRHTSGFVNHGTTGQANHPSDPKEYMSMYQGCQLGMLAGVICEVSSDFWMKHRAQQATSSKAAVFATSVLRNETLMSFVGITDAWNASICLFHAMFGGRISAVDFENTRPAKSQSERPVYFEVKDDPYDWAIFEIGRRLFIDRLEQYGLAVPESLRLTAKEKKELREAMADETVRRVIMDIQVNLGHHHLTDALEAG